MFTLVVVVIGFWMIRRGALKGGLLGGIRAAFSIVRSVWSFTTRQAISEPSRAFGAVPVWSILIGAVLLVCLIHSVASHETSILVAFLQGGLICGLVSIMVTRFRRKPKRARPLPRRKR